MTNQAPARPDHRNKIYDILDGERDYQDVKHPTSPDHPIEHFANLLIEYTDKLAVDLHREHTGASPSGDPFKRLREVAAIAVHAMEVHGVQPRENHVPASAGITGTLKLADPGDKLRPPPRK